MNQNPNKPQPLSIEQHKDQIDYMRAEEEVSRLGDEMLHDMLTLVYPSKEAQDC